MSQPDEFLDRQPDPADTPEPCPDCGGSLVWDDGLPCETCAGTGRWDPRPARLSREQLRRLEAALAEIHANGGHIAPERLARCAASSSANGSGESSHRTGSHGSAVRPGPALVGLSAGVRP